MTAVGKICYAGAMAGIILFRNAWMRRSSTACHELYTASEKEPIQHDSAVLREA